MPLDMCPHMAARCPHKETRCQDPESKQCHYIATATASAFTTIAALRAHGVERLSLGQRHHFDNMERLIASLQDPPYPQRKRY